MPCRQLERSRTWGTFPTCPQPNGTLETCPTTCARKPRMFRTKTLQRVEKRSHLFRSVLVSGPQCQRDARSQQRLGLIALSLASQQLGKLEISRDVIGVFVQQLPEVHTGRLRVPV